MRKQIIGVVKRHPDGFGFLIPDEPDIPDVYINSKFMLGVMTNDRLLVEIYQEKGPGHRLYGKVIKILERGTKRIVGQFKIGSEQKYGTISDEGKGWGAPLVVSLDHSKNAKNGEMVAAEIVSFPDDPKGFRGKIVDILGDSLDPMTDLKRVIYGNNLPYEFSPQCLYESNAFSLQVKESDFEKRTDYRALNFITIDGATAKDFDDAVYVTTNKKGFLLYVAIADVSHYVKKGTAIDKDAYERGTSVYFPNFVVPMLPEVLSNELCSLKPMVPRLALVAEIQFDFEGETLESHFYEAVIESKARVTYGEAQEIIEGVVHERLQHVSSDIGKAADLAKILMAKRFKEGSLDLEIPEIILEIDGAGIPVDVIKSERLFSHRLIEELMLAANVAVATFLSEKEIPVIYRVHDSPNPDALSILEKYLWNFGGQSKIQGGKIQKKLTKALLEFEGKPESQVLNILTLRSMSQAKYSCENIGHFGLGFEFYTHFTSPIRRYPDLIVHRLIKSQILKAKKFQSQIPTLEDLETSAVMLSACEQRAVKAERQLQSIKKARFMEKHIGEVFDGVISSVAKFGVFVMLRAYGIDGLIRLEKLGRGGFEFNEEALKLVGRGSGLIYSIGDLLKVRVLHADPQMGQIDFELAELPFRGAKENFNRSKEDFKGANGDGDFRIAKENLNLAEDSFKKRNFKKNNESENSSFKNRSSNKNRNRKADKSRSSDKNRNQGKSRKDDKNKEYDHGKDHKKDHEKEHGKNKTSNRSKYEPKDKTNFKISHKANYTNNNSFKASEEPIDESNQLIKSQKMIEILKRLDEAAGKSVKSSPHKSSNQSIESKRKNKGKEGKSYGNHKNRKTNRKNT